jgi:hypothetical protein
MSADYLKPLAAAGVAIALDKYVLNQQDMNSSLYFGASTGAGILAANLLGPYLPNLASTFSSTSYYNANTVEQRLLEVGLSVGTGFVINTYLLKNTSYYSNDDMMKRVAVIAAADFISEYLTDYSTGQSLSYLI